ncbi:TPA: twin-arginine translocase TatA/TatE family subunit [Legionella pneumophila]|jgi:sec-independent protein translocase protein TatA|uniref:Sec-independent protein translocase protein TatA n=1 Tax=Legionella pneumophila TaxID=446 RepID=A0AAN5KRK6_LEGPN|nr:twin-arginine translocase TatA/TatE family subunit [Legionella pneumophila]HAT1596609.1 twin-arginine translocase TatA/TatE family subunit [Legionella pneumophila]HAT1972789.1 twin-arginine translocase TatA/TatE family subunit [Legionella pneumophila]HAT3976914.1 twin-arginine translocase TatA/TatE family subunit [Legionella pneumophila]HAT6957345.1 twin-arginine translocase TatA/TatE family subunit [Legionella pneumophila]HAT8355730.1 twin-arginine translocase TatA/TatE family subunit [Leg
MGLSGISPLSLLLILAIIVALFGTSKLKTIGSDLGEAIKNFRKAMNSEETNDIQKDDHKPS